MTDKIQHKAVNTLRALAVETISNAKSGHSGIALGAAPIMYAAYKAMRIDPDAPGWFNRDRFVLSAGHGSALLYSALNLFGFPVARGGKGETDLSTFRRLGSKLTGHPELDEKIGVDCSTGPLGQGVGMAVGIALAEKRLAAMYPGMIDHFTYCICGDGCLMEGVSYETCNLAGLWKLNKLVMLYDSNDITLDGTRAAADGEDVSARFAAMKWNVITVGNGNDTDAVAYALSICRGEAPSAEKDQTFNVGRMVTSEVAPTLIVCRTTIGYGAKTAGTNKAHGSVLGISEIAEMRKNWGLCDETFEIDADVAAHFAEIAAKKKGSAKAWQKQLLGYKTKSPKQYEGLKQFIEKPELTLDLKAEGKEMALRDAGGVMLGQIAKQSARLWGGSADVASTTKAYVEGGGFFGLNNLLGADIPFGVREFAMSAIANGIALHGFTPYVSTFLAFSDYCKPAMRLSALMNLPVTYVFSHDGLGNAPDGPTHQATEHISALRLIPNMRVWRPADDVECAAVYKCVFEEGRPACIILGRGNVPPAITQNVKKPAAVLVSSGAEISLCINAQKLLAERNVAVNVISVPCMELFAESNESKEIKKLGCPVIAVEVGHGGLWWRFADDVISFDTFGHSGTNDEVMSELGFTADKIAQRVQNKIRP